MELLLNASLLLQLQGVFSVFLSEVMSICVKNTLRIYVINFSEIISEVNRVNLLVLKILYLSLFLAENFMELRS